MCGYSFLQADPCTHNRHYEDSTKGKGTASQIQVLCASSNHAWRIPHWLSTGDEKVTNWVIDIDTWCMKISSSSTRPYSSILELRFVVSASIDSVLDWLLDYFFASNKRYIGFCYTYHLPIFLTLNCCSYLYTLRSKVLKNPYEQSFYCLVGDFLLCAVF